MRLFVAITLDETIRENLISIQELIQRYQPDAKLVDAENIHLTLRFLGEISEDILPRISEVLSTVNDCHCFEMELRNIGAFPSVKKPRVIWIGCEDRTSALNKIYQTLESGFRAIGLQPDDKEFSAHITIARDKIPKPNNNFEALANKYANKSFGIQMVKQVTLFQSTLTPNGPIYTNISDFKLK
ncbi:MAG: RNA 2',3'-cyclic phosphodiesterase [Planctomycetota bacterium]